ATCCAGLGYQTFEISGGEHAQEVCRGGCRMGLPAGGSIAPPILCRCVRKPWRDIRHVLLISVDGMHSLDFANCANGISGFKGSGTYCPNLKALALHGVNYLNSSTSKPSDSF